MSEIEKKTNGLEAIADDELDAVAGGFRDDNLAQAMRAAQTDGRKYNLANDIALSNAFCPCHYTYKWARINKVIKNGVTIVNLRGYTDVKCYCCGKTDTGCIY